MASPRYESTYWLWNIESSTLKTCIEKQHNRLSRLCVNMYANVGWQKDHGITKVLIPCIKQTPPFEWVVKIFHVIPKTMQIVDIAFRCLSDFVGAFLIIKRLHIQDTHFCVYVSVCVRQYNNTNQRKRTFKTEGLYRELRRLEEGKGMGTVIYYYFN